MVMLPEDGELRLGPVALPTGRRIFAMARPEPVAWATIAEVPGAGLVWAALSQSHEQTGLVPFLLEGLDNTTARPWESGELGGSADVSELDHIDAASVLEGLWAGKTHVGHTEEWGQAGRRGLAVLGGPVRRHLAAGRVLEDPAAGPPPAAHRRNRSADSRRAVRVQQRAPPRTQRRQHLRDHCSPGRHADLDLLVGLIPPRLPLGDAARPGVGNGQSAQSRPGSGRAALLRRKEGLLAGKVAKRPQ